MSKTVLTAQPTPAFGLKPFSSHNRKRFIRRLVFNLKKNLEDLDLNDADIAMIPQELKLNSENTESH
jgi:hypothetical protein